MPGQSYYSRRGRGETATRENMKLGRLLACTLLLACSGCVTDWLDLTDSSYDNYCERNRRNLTKLNLGMTMAEVEEIMGTGSYGDPTDTPLSVQERSPVDAGDGTVYYVTRWLYLTRPLRILSTYTGLVSNREVTAAVFNAEGFLIAWGAQGN